MADGDLGELWLDRACSIKLVGAVEEELASMIATHVEAVVTGGWGSEPTLREGGGPRVVVVVVLKGSLQVGLN